jgi:hypothetical protein
VFDYTIAVSGSGVSLNNVALELRSVLQISFLRRLELDCEKDVISPLKKEI